MEAFGLYLVKSVVWLAGFALVFFLFLRNERFFLLNRIYLLTGILVSFLLPLVSVHYTVIMQVTQLVQTGNPTTGIIEPSGSSVEMMLSVIYLTGALFVISLICKQSKSILKAIRNSELVSSRPVKILMTPDHTSPFSFFSYMFVNPSITDIETREIMIHELVHIRQKHWFDLLLAESLRVMQWFNPVAWIYIRFIRQNHEYLADEVALQQTTDPAVYKAVLLNQIIGAPVFSLTNSFNYSPNKKRFTMMKHIVTSPWRKTKVLFILPVIAIVLWSFAKPDVKYKFVGDGSAIDTLKKHGHDIIAPPPPPSVPDTLSTVPLGLPSPPPPPPPPPQPDSVQKALVVIDGRIMNLNVKDIDAETIESLTVLKGKQAINKYGQKGKDGAIEIITKHPKSDKEFEDATKQPAQHMNLKLEPAVVQVDVKDVVEPVEPLKVDAVSPVSVNVDFAEPIKVVIQDTISKVINVEIDKEVTETH